MATTGSNVTLSIAQTAQFVQEAWTRDIQQPFDAKLQAAKLVTDRSGLAKGVDTIRVPFAGTVNARAKAASTAVTYDSPEGTAVTHSINKHYYVATLIEDVAKVQSNYDLKSAFQQRMAEGVARQIDTDLMTLYTGAGATVTGGAAIDDADILSVVYNLDNANVPQDQRRGIIGHNTKTDLLGINKYVAYDQTGKTGKAVDGSTGLVGSLYGMDIYHSGNVQTSTTGRNLFFHKSALVLAQAQRPKFEMEYSVDYVGWKTVVHAIYGVGVERASALVELTRTTAP
jgi:hypothetical protein